MTDKPQTLAEQIRALEPPRGMGPASIMRSGWNEAIKEAAALADAAPPAEQAGDVGRAWRVKPLVWFEVEKSRYGGKYTADGYTIRYIEGRWLMDFGGHSKSIWNFSDLGAAQSAAQADYTARINAALADAETLDNPECTDCEGSGITHQTERYCTCDMGRELFAESANNPDPTPVVMPEWSTSDKARHYAAMVADTNDADILRAAISDLCRDNERLAVMLKSAKQPAPTPALGCKAMQAELATLRAERDALREVLAEGRRAIGDHFAPHDCYATGPMTGDPFRDLVQCPACSFIAMHDEALKGGA